MKTFVLDTSVVIKWYSEHDEDDLKKALILRDGILERTVSVIVKEPFRLLYLICSFTNSQMH